MKSCPCGSSEAPQIYILVSCDIFKMLMLFEFLQVTVHLWEGLWTVQVFKDSSSSQPSPHTQGHNAENAGGWHRQKWRGMCMRIETNLLPLRLSIVSSVPACLEQPFRFTFSKIYTHLGAGAGLPVPCVIWWSLNFCTDLSLKMAANWKCSYTRVFNPAVMAGYKKWSGAWLAEVTQKLYFVPVNVTLQKHGAVQLSMNGEHKCLPFGLCVSRLQALERQSSHLQSMTLATPGQGLYIKSV